MVSITVKVLTCELVCGLRPKFISAVNVAPIHFSVSLVRTLENAFAFVLFSPISPDTLASAFRPCACSDFVLVISTGMLYRSLPLPCLYTPVIRKSTLDPISKSRSEAFMKLPSASSGSNVGIAFSPHWQAQT